MNRTRAYWICQISGWMFVTGFGLMLMLWETQKGWEVVPNQIISFMMGVGLTHAFRGYAHRAEWIDLSLKRLVPRVIAATLVLTVGYVGLCDLVIYLNVVDVVGMEETEYWSMRRVVLSLFGGAILMGFWLVLYFGVHSFWSYRQAEIDKWKLEAQAETARLKALKLQLNPHFFFNSLNSVRALIAEDPDRAQRMVTRLARLLRTTLQVNDVKTVSLRDELSTVRTYLKLEKVRFEDRLRSQIHTTDEALDRPVPFLLVQTLVENGIKHGIAPRQDGGTITIDAQIDEGALRLCIRNPGTLTSEEGGIGLDNARERLRLLFGEEATLTLHQKDSDHVVARVILPDREEAPAVRPTTTSHPEVEATA